MIQCNRCHLQYIGETKRSLKDRFNEHRRTVDSPNSKSSPTTAAKHFLLTPSSDIQLIPIEKILSYRNIDLMNTVNKMPPQVGSEKINQPQNV